MLIRLRQTIAAVRDGSYDYTAILGVLVAVAGLVVEAAQQLEGLPPALTPWVALLLPYARLIVLLGSGVAAMGKSLFVRGDA